MPLPIKRSGIIPDLSGAGCYVAIGGIHRLVGRRGKAALALGVGEGEITGEFCCDSESPIVFHFKRIANRRLIMWALADGGGFWWMVV